MVQFKTRDGDTLDYICWKQYDSQQSGAVESVLEANRGLAKLGPTYPAGVVIELPELPNETLDPLVRLWD